MSTNIILKKSSIPGRVPGTGDLNYGEVAINYADGRLYYKTSSNTIDHFTSSVLDSNQILSLVDSDHVRSKIDKTFINNLDVNAGTLDGQDGTYFLNYNNFYNTPIIPDSAFIGTIASTTTSPADSASVRSAVDSAFIQSLVGNDYVATIVDSAYVALRVGDFAENFGTIAVVGDLSIDATSGGDTVTFAAGNGVQIATDVANKRVTFSANVNPSFDFGTFSAPSGISLDMGAI